VLGCARLLDGRICLNVSASALKCVQLGHPNHWSRALGVRALTIKSPKRNLRIAPHFSISLTTQNAPSALGHLGTFSLNGTNTLNTAALPTRYGGGLSNTGSILLGAGEPKRRAFITCPGSLATLSRISRCRGTDGAIDGVDWYEKTLPGRESDERRVRIDPFDEKLYRFGVG
jgi:hypothetical protein